MGRDPRIVKRFQNGFARELADDSTMMPGWRAGLLEMAGNHRAEISDRERANRFAHTVPTRSGSQHGRSRAALRSPSSTAS
jgi:hypothetical protein